MENLVEQPQDINFMPLRYLPPSAKAGRFTPVAARKVAVIHPQALD
jgi:hypothetical protein